MTAPQDAHKRLVLQVAEWLTASLHQGSREASDMSFCVQALKERNRSAVTYLLLSARKGLFC